LAEASNQSANFLASSSTVTARRFSLSVHGNHAALADISIIRRSLRSCPASVLTIVEFPKYDCRQDEHKYRPLNPDQPSQSQIFKLPVGAAKKHKSTKPKLLEIDQLRKLGLPRRTQA
jgi:hypothetical protein